METLLHNASVDIERAFLTIVNTIHEVEEERAAIVNAFNRTLSRPIIANTNVPAHNTATKDGYAAIAQYTSGASEKDPKNMSVWSETSLSVKNIEPGTVVRVKAGDPLPHKTDTVIEFSKTYRPDNGPEILVLAEVKPNENIRPAGSIIAEGQTVIHKGTKITSHEMSIMAALGIQGVPIRRKPKVAIITTGVSTIDILEKMELGKTRNSARYALVGMILDSGCEIGQLLHIKEGRIALEKAITACLDYDAIIISPGREYKHDTALSALKNISDVHFDRIHLEPCSSSAFAMANGKPIFVAPEKAITEAYEAVIRPGLLKLLGRSSLTRQKVHAISEAPLQLNPGYSHYIKAQMHISDGKYFVKPLNQHTHEHPDSLIVIPQNVDSIKRGGDVEILVIG